MDYQGYKLIDKIILVCRDKAVHDDSHGCNGGNSYYQAYLVDPSNTKQLESARHWAKWTEYGPSYKNDAGDWVRDYEIVHEPVEFEFANNCFALELLDCAGGSSQGGKLSFWNCLVTRDDKIFKIGINSDMLLDLLKSTTFVNGKCQGSLRFITKNGKVGMTVEGSETWQQCIKDRELKNDLKKRMVSNFSFGDKISTTTISEIYLGTLTQYYTFEDRSYSQGYRGISVNPHYCVLTKLAKPIEYHLTEENWGTSTLKDFEKLSDVINYYKGSDTYYSIYSWPDLKKKCAKRAISGKLEIDCTEEDFYKSILEKAYDYKGFEEYCLNSYHYSHDANKILCYFLSRGIFGFGTEPFDLSEELMNRIKDAGIRYIDETKQA